MNSPEMPHLPYIQVPSITHTHKLVLLLFVPSPPTEASKASLRYSTGYINASLIKA